MPTYFLLDLDLLNSYTRNNKVGIRLCDMVPWHLGGVEVLFLEFVVK